MTRLSICWRVEESRQKREVVVLGGALGEEGLGGGLGEEDLAGALGEAALGGGGGAMWEDGRSMSRSDTPGWRKEFIAQYQNENESLHIKRHHNSSSS